MTQNKITGNSQSTTSNLLAVLLIHFSTFHGFSAAIATIVATAFVVVLVVAIAVALVLRQRAGRLLVSVRVEALALRTNTSP